MKRYADLMAEARAEYAADFRALGVRSRLWAAPPGIHRNRVLSYDPWCLKCGRPTKAKGLCLTHYVIEYRKAARRRRGLAYVRGQTNVVCGHLDRRHHAHGRCNACDYRARRGGRKNKDGSNVGALRQPTHPCPVTRTH